MYVGNVKTEFVPLIMATMKDKIIELIRANKMEEADSLLGDLRHLNDKYVEEISRKAE